MATQPDLSSFSLNSLQHRCAGETQKFFNRQEHDPTYCYELFRRAILQRDQHAWELVYAQYHALVAGWIQRSTLFHTLEEDLDYFINRAFEKMWASLTSDKFAGFPDLKSLLRYLQMCSFSALVDSARQLERAAQIAEAELSEVEPRISIERPDPEDIAIRREQARLLWNMLEERLKSEQERIVLYGSWVQGLKPGEIYQVYPGAFRDTREVYLVKDNLLARLRRDTAMRQAFGDA